MNADYALVPLANGTFSIRLIANGETFHPVIGPMAEAEALYIRQLKLRERATCRPHPAGEEAERQRNAGGALDPFVIWDIGLGAGGNVLTTLHQLKEVPAHLHIVSFDHTLGALRFALEHAAALQFPVGLESVLEELLHTRRVEFRHGALQVTWEIHVGDFPAALTACAPGSTGNLPVPCGGPPHGTEGRPELFQNALGNLMRPPIPPGQWPGGTGRLPVPPEPAWPAPHAIFFDAYSPARNPAMWTRPLFENLFRRLDPQRPCTLATYTRSTIPRVTLLLAGFFVGAGDPVAAKNETTIASNSLELIARPLGARWLERARTSHSAEPLHANEYRIAPLAAETWERLRAHPQFNGETSLSQAGSGC